MTTFLHRFAENDERFADKPAFIRLDAKLEAADILTFSELATRSAALAGGLLELTKAGERVLIIFPSGTEFVIAFLSCLRAGIIPVPLPMLGNRRSRDRFRGVLADCQPSLILTTDQGQTALGPEEISIPAITLAGIPSEEKNLPSPGDIAFLQYTSGTTGSPKGVIITQANLASQLKGLDTLAEGPAETHLMWLPLYHDFGLVAGILRSLWVGNTTYLLAPALVNQSSGLWLQALARYKIAVAYGTNSLLLACLAGKENLSSTSFSALQSLFLGGEFITSSALHAFSSAFDIPLAKLQPIYGMAETTLAATAGGELDIEVHCGPALPTMEISFCEGEIMADGPSVSPGYWDRPPRQGPFPTGDLGHFDPAGNLIIAGRKSDLIIINGENFHPEDLEANLEKFGPAVALPFSANQDDGLLILAEIPPGFPSNQWAPRISEIRKILESDHGIAAGRIGLIRSHRLPRTSSGKLQRGQASELFLSGQLRALLDWQAAEGPKSGKTPAEIADWFQEQFALIPGFESGQVDPTTDFYNLGLDSTHAISFALELEDFLEVEVPSSALFDYPCIDALAAEYGAHP
jgi:acyl-CoA synthetase (AMP-forming)/AMP-acid ligase II/acyl carrier protein